MSESEENSTEVQNEITEPVNQDIQTVADLVTRLTHCSSDEAIKAEEALCQSQEALTELSQACGINIARTALAGGVIVMSVEAMAVPGLQIAGVAGVTAGTVLAARGATRARVYCNAFIQHSVNKTTKVAESYLGLLKEKKEDE